MTTKRHTAGVRLSARAIGTRIRKLRRRREWTGSELAVACGMQESRLSKIELGKNLPSLKDAISLSLKLRRSLEWVLYGTPPRAKLWTYLARQRMGGRM